jgi:hypothetical protein
MHEKWTLGFLSVHSILHGGDLHVDEPYTLEALATDISGGPFLYW